MLSEAAINLFEIEERRVACVKGKVRVRVNRTPGTFSLHVEPTPASGPPQQSSFSRRARAIFASHRMTLLTWPCQAANSPLRLRPNTSHLDDSFLCRHRSVLHKNHISSVWRASIRATLIKPTETNKGLQDDALLHFGTSMCRCNAQPKLLAAPSSSRWPRAKLTVGNSGIHAADGRDDSLHGSHHSFAFYHSPKIVHVCPADHLECPAATHR
jgi:hypothetical protein